MRERFSITKIYQLSGRLLSRRSIGKFFAEFGKAILAILLYAAWLVGEFAVAIYVLYLGFHPAIALFLILAMDVIGRGVFRHGKTDFKSWKAWFCESYVENILLIPRWILAALIVLSAIIAAYVYLK